MPYYSRDVPRIFFSGGKSYNLKKTAESLRFSLYVYARYAPIKQRTYIHVYIAIAVEKKHFSLVYVINSSKYFRGEAPT